MGRGGRPGCLGALVRPQLLPLYVRQLRIGAGLTHQAAADISGLTGRTLRYWEAGQVQPTSRALMRYEQAVSKVGAQLQLRLLHRLALETEATATELAGWCNVTPSQATTALGLLHRMGLVLDLKQGWYALAPLENNVTAT